jgi:hypothetical protein
MDVKSDDGLHSFSFAKFKYFPSDDGLHSFSFAKFNNFPSDDGLHSFCSQHSKTFQAKGWIAFFFVHKHSNTSHSNNCKSQEHMWERSNLVCILDSSLNLNDISAFSSSKGIL